MFEFINIVKFTDVLIAHRLTPNQLFILLCLAMGRNKGFVQLFRYTEETGNTFDRSEIHDLVDRGYLISFSEGADNADDFDVTDKFREEFFTDDPMLAAEEFWDAYPSFFNINGRQAVTKSNVNKELLLMQYAKEIGYSKALHETVLKAIAWAKENALINFRIGDFVSTYWRDIVAQYSEAMNTPRQELTNDTYYE